VSVGQFVPKTSVVGEANAIGHTAKGVEEWVERQPMRVECMGLAPYPGSVVPRVVGLLIAAHGTEYEAPEIKEVRGNALEPKGPGPKLVVHVIPDTNNMWGGGGFASHMRRQFPYVWTDFRKEAGPKRPPALGNVYFGELTDDVCVAHMVAQRGIGPSSTPRIRYAALAQCLGEVREKARTLGASVHMPRVGTGNAGGDWAVVKELIAEELVDKGIATTVYSLPS
jgi:O-acetyl-ADP-ribose deacetylase (regulator of RNase III)